MMNDRRGLFNLLGGAAIVLGLVGLYFEVQGFSALYSPPIYPAPESYNYLLLLVPPFLLIVGLAAILGTNVVKRRKTRIGLLIATATILLVSTLWMASAIAYDQANNPWATARVSAIVNACHASSASCSILLTNTGTGSTNIVGCYFANVTSRIAGVLTSKASIQAGGRLTVTCQQSSDIGVVAGAQVDGFVQMSNGGLVPFASVWA